MLPKSSPLPLPVKHVLVDYENMHEIDLGVFGQESIQLSMLVGPTQRKLDADLVEKLLEHAATVQLVRLKSAAKNALDFALAYYLGQAVAANPRGRFVIASKDKGYDPLVEHLRARNLNVCREENWGMKAGLVPQKTKLAAAPPPTANAETAASPGSQPSEAKDPQARVLEALRKADRARPGTRKRLASWIIAHLGKATTEADALRWVEQLGQAGHLSVDDKGKVTYQLSRA